MNAAGYIRVSTRKQADGGYSLDEQRQAVIDRCKSEGWDLTLYEDAGLSAAEGKHRPELERLLTDAEAGRFDVVVFRDLDRVGRSVVDLSRIVGGLERVRIVTLEGRNVDRSTAEGRLQFNVLASVAEYERAKIGERVAGSARSRAQRGLFPGGRRMKYGYRRCGKDEPPEIIESQAVIVRRMFEESAAGKSQRHITRDLNRDGIPTQEGKRWEQGTVARILADPTYKGSITIKGEIIFEGGDWRIVSDELWARVAALKAARDKAPGKGRGRKPAGDFVFNGHMLKCGCGGAFMARTYRTGREVYVCRQHWADPALCSMPPIPRAQIDNAALSYFENAGLDVAATAEQFKAAVDHKLAEARAWRLKAEQEHAQRLSALERLEADYLAGQLSADSYERLSARVSDELAALRAQVDQFTAQERDIAADAQLEDAEGAMLRYLTQIRRAIVGEVKNAQGIDAVRAALCVLFEHFTYERTMLAHDGKVTEAYTLTPEIREDAIASLREIPELDVRLPSPSKVPLSVRDIDKPTACSWRDCLLAPIPVPSGRSEAPIA